MSRLTATQPDNQFSRLSARTAYNGESSSIPSGRIVTLKDSNNGAAPKAYLAKSSDPSLWSGTWAVSRGGFGTAQGEDFGTVVDWAFGNLDTSSSGLEASVFASESTPGTLTLTPSAFTAQVGVVVRVGTSATDTANTVLIYPEAFRHRAGSKALVPDVADTATYTTSSIGQGSGGIVQLAIPAGAETRNLPAPVVMNQEITLGAISDAGGSIAITAASAINQAGNTVMTFADAEDLITLRAFPIAGATALRWRVTHNDGVVLS